MYPKAINTPRALESAVRLSDLHNLDWLDECCHSPEMEDGVRRVPWVWLLCAALRWGSNFEEAIDKATRINGDSDSVGCLAGMFLGVEGGTSNYCSWLNALPARGDLETLHKNYTSTIPFKRKKMST